MGTQIESVDGPAFAIQSFVEKPDRPTADPILRIRDDTYGTAGYS